jgi:hypothetical protein
VNSIWAVAIVLPVVAAIILAVIIVAVGEFYLALGKDGALIAAISLMTLITVIAAGYSLRNRSAH